MSATFYQPFRVNLSLLTFFVLSLLTFQSQAQMIRYVSNKGTNPDPGGATTWANSTTDLQGAINASAAGDQVWVAQGTYKPTISSGPDSRTVSFSMKAGVTIYGGFSDSGYPAFTDRNPVSYATVLSGDINNDGQLSGNSYHVIFNNFSTFSLTGDIPTILDGFTITGGNANGEGNNATGGGIFNAPTSAILRNCTVRDNFGNFGGGLASTEFGISKLTSCTITNNSANVGGGISASFYGSSDLTNCTITNNTALMVGGGVYTNNKSGSRLINCVVANNTSSMYGGGVYNSWQGSAALVNCTLTGNAAVSGGAISSSESSGGVYLANSIAWNNGGQNAFYYNSYGSAGYAVSATNSLIESGAIFYDQGANLTATTSPFVSSSNLQLQVGSLAIDQGSNDLYNNYYKRPGDDLAGNTRIVNTRIDIGAYEYQGAVCQPVAITQQPVSSSSTCAGSTVTAAISVTGTSPTYQWYRNGTSLGETQQASTLSLTNVQATSSGLYFVIVTSSCNSVTSTTFSLTVNALPTAPSLTANPTTTTTNQPILVSASGCSGGTVNWTALGGAGQASENSYTFSQPGNYTLLASCSLGSCTSQASPPLKLQILPGRFAITSVGTVSCQLTNPDRGEYQVQFTPQYSGQNETPISFSVVNELTPTSAPAPYSLRLYTDNPVITLVAQQGTTEARYAYNWLTACTSSSQPASLSITGVTTVNCQTVTATERRLSFTPQYSGQTAEPISFSVVNELLPTTQPGPYTLRVYTDNPVITLVAQQVGQQSRFSYNWLAGCMSIAARRSIESQEVLQVSLLGNPVRDDQVSFEIRGANAQPLQLRLLTPQGQMITQRQVVNPQSIERQQLSLSGQAGSLFLLQVSTPKQAKTVKVIKAQ